MREKRGPNKYRAHRCEVDGERFDSLREARRWTELKQMEKTGEIEDLQRQVRFPLVVCGQKVGTYVADFVYRKDGVAVIEDAKGVPTPVYRLKKKLMKAIYDVEIRES